MSKKTKIILSIVGGFCLLIMIANIVLLKETLLSGKLWANMYLETAKNLFKLTLGKVK